MAAKDYDIIESAFGNFYFAKRLKSKRRTMSQDRRPITEDEVLGMFERYLRRRCEENENNTLQVTCGDKLIFEATLHDFPHGCTIGKNLEHNNDTPIREDKDEQV